MLRNGFESHERVVYRPPIYPLRLKKNSRPLSDRFEHNGISLSSNDVIQHDGIITLVGLLIDVQENGKKTVKDRFHLAKEVERRHAQIPLSWRRWRDYGEHTTESGKKRFYAALNSYISHEYEESELPRKFLETHRRAHLANKYALGHCIPRRAIRTYEKIEEILQSLPDAGATKLIPVFTPQVIEFQDSQWQRGANLSLAKLTKRLARQMRRVKVEGIDMKKEFRILRESLKAGDSSKLFPHGYLNSQAKSA